MRSNALFVYRFQISGSNVRKPSWMEFIIALIQLLKQCTHFCLLDGTILTSHSPPCMFCGFFQPSRADWEQAWGRRGEMPHKSSFWLPIVQNPAPGFLVSVLIVLKVSVALEKQPVDTNQWCFAIRMQMVFPLLE